MDGMNSYENAGTVYGNADLGNTPPKKKAGRQIAGVILLIVGIICLVVGALNMFGGSSSGSEDKDDAVDIYEAEETDEYAYTYVQYMTDPVAYYEAMESMQFYIAMDAEWNPVVVCLHDDDMETYQPYIDWLYTESYENGPEETDMYGYAQPFDYELEQLVIEGFADCFGEGYVDYTNFEDFFGEYYLYVGEKSEVYETATIGLIFLVVGIIALIVGAVLLHGGPKIQNEQSGSNGPVIEESPNIALGLVGAIVGAAIGGVLWVVVGLAGYVSGWVAVAMMFFSHYGYKLFTHKDDRKGKFICFLISMVMIFAAHYITWCVVYYQSMNADIAGYTSFARAVVELPGFMSSCDLWGDFALDMVLGYVFAIIMGISWLSPDRKNETKN